MPMFSRILMLSLKESFSQMQPNAYYVELDRMTQLGGAGLS